MMRCIGVLYAAAMLLAGATQGYGAVSLQRLQVEYRPTPLGIDVERPRFSWQMAASAGEREVAQKAYQLVVRDAKGTVVWDSGRTEDSASVGIRYAGPALKAAARYSWSATAWTNGGAKLTAASWFETGLMDPKPDSPAWTGAQWIGGGNEDLVLYAPYLSIFDVHYALTIPQGSTRASFVYGANDPRLMDRNKNIYQLENGRDQSYIQLTLDISGLEGAGSGNAKLLVYRAGYQATDDPAKPVKVFDISPDLIHRGNRNAEHVIEFRSTFGQIALSVDGKASFLAPGTATAATGPQEFPWRRTLPNAVNLNPAGTGGDYLPFGLLCDMGFAMDAGQKARFRDVTVRHSRAPRNALFREDLTAIPYRGIYAGSAVRVDDGAYFVDGGSRGAFVVRDPSRNAMPMLRTRFEAKKAVVSARLYVTARGIYEVFLNGKRISEDRYNPGLTQYNVTHMYQTYDVTPLIRPGANAMGAMLAEGWWSGLLSFGTVWNHFGDRQSLRAKLVLTYPDGTVDTVVTNDASWKYFGAGPVVYGSLDHGEVYDASREQAVEGWSTAAYDDRAWKKAQSVPLEGAAFVGSDSGIFGRPGMPLRYDRFSLIGQIGNNAGAFRTLTAKSVKEVRPGVFVYDLGQNIVGVPRIRIDNGKAGGKVTLRYAEMLYPDLKESGRNTGMIMTENYRAAMSQDIYTMKAGAQVLEPRFTSHGFQFIEITGVDKALPVEAVQGVAISSVRELAADYRSSNEKVNRLWWNLVWSNIDNFLTIPTDCPQRNERMGWSGDINVFSRTATYVSNADQFLTRHMYAMRDVQEPNGRFTDVAPVGGGFGGVLWGSAGIVVPWETYLQYNDLGLLEQHYPAMAAYADYLQTTIDPKTGFTSDGQLGDWLGPQNNLMGTAYLATAYLAYDLGIMVQVAELLGKHEDADRFRQRYQERKAFFNRTFVNDEGRTQVLVGGRDAFGGTSAPVAGPPKFRVADTQTTYAVGLGMGLFEDTKVATMRRNLVEAVARENPDDQGKLLPKYSLMTGFIGTAWISKALSDAGASETAYRLLQNRQYPSWLYAIDQGATTIWERLNGYTVENGFGGNNSMNSFNHYSFGAVGQWLMAYSLGIQRDQPGFHKFVLQPEPDPTGAMTWAEGYYDSMYGRIRSSWKIDRGTLRYQATVPANTTARLLLPTADAASVKEGGKPVAAVPGVKLVKYDQGRAEYELSSGSYDFTARWR